MKEHGFLFCGDMVRALASTHAPKTMTRRLLTRPRSLVDGHAATAAVWARLEFSCSWVDPGPSPAGNPGPYLKVPTVDGDTTHRVYPRVQVGDVIWVKETYCDRYFDDWSSAYRADYNKDAVGNVVPEPRWSPSMFMPRRLARTLLDVLAVRPERLQDISERDACAEGIGNPVTRDCKVPKFARLWDELNYKKAPWVSNPLVWAYTFQPRAA